MYNQWGTIPYCSVTKWGRIFQPSTRQPISHGYPVFPKVWNGENQPTNEICNFVCFTNIVEQVDFLKQRYWCAISQFVFDTLCTILICKKEVITHRITNWPRFLSDGVIRSRWQVKRQIQYNKVHSCQSVHFLSGDWLGNFNWVIARQCVVSLVVILTF